MEEALAAGALPLELVHNDLADAARSLCPAIDDGLAALRDAGARRAIVSGSGPTAVGLFDAPADAQAAARAVPGALAVEAHAP